MTVELAFSEGKAPNGYKDMQEWPFCEPKKGHRIVPCLALYGANASGKTNIIKALSVFKKIALGNFENVYFPNKININEETTKFSLNFITNNQQYSYTIEYDAQKIVKEELIENASVLYVTNNGCINYDSYIGKTISNDKSIENIFKLECMHGTQQLHTLLSVIAEKYHNLDKSIKNVFEYLQKLEIYPGNRISLYSGLEKLSELYTIEHVLEEISEIIKNLDIGIVRINLDSLSFEPGILKTTIDTNSIGIYRRSLPEIIYSYRNDRNGNEVKFNFNDDESKGTKVLVGLISLILFVLKNGGVLVIDELDNSLHSFVLIEIVRMFKDKDYNTNNSQIIFTVNNTDLLDANLLRVSEVGIINKTTKKGTIFKRISDYEEMRNITNFRKQYLHGAFHGLPNPYI